MGWVAEPCVRDRHFERVSDHGYHDASELISNKKRNGRKKRNGTLKLQILPPDDQRIRNIPSQVCRLLSDAVGQDVAAAASGLRNKCKW